MFDYWLECCQQPKPLHADDCPARQVKLRNYTSFESLDEYYRYMAYACRKLPEHSKGWRLNWHAVGYGYRMYIMRQT